MRLLTPDLPHVVDVHAASDEVVCLNITAEAFGTHLLDLIRSSLKRESEHQQWVVTHAGDVSCKYALKLGATLGVGTFGRVRIATHALTRRTYALKTVDKALVVASNIIPSLEAEWGCTLQTVCHPFMLKMSAAFRLLATSTWFWSMCRAVICGSI